jgi:phage FluMu protein Com
MDLMAPYGTPVYAIQDGILEQVSSGGWTYQGTENRGLVIRHSSPTEGFFKAIYGHIELSTCVRCAPAHINQPVAKGQLLGYVGTHGGGNHLHFGIWVSQYAIYTDYGTGPVANFPQQYLWRDPVKFIETTCPTSAPQSCYNNADLALALHDMKTGMIGKYDVLLRPLGGDLRWVWYDQSQGYNHYKCWFFKTVNGVTTWREAVVAIHQTNKHSRWWSFFWNDGTWHQSDWNPVVDTL